MERKKGLFSHFGVLIRIVILIVLLALIAFFVVRFVQNRQNTNKAKQAAQTSKSQNESSETAEKEDSQAADSSEQGNNSDSSVPSGIADSDVVPATGPAEIPATGVSSDIFITMVMLVTIGYFGAKNFQQRKELS